MYDFDPSKANATYAKTIPKREYIRDTHHNSAPRNACDCGTTDEFPHCPTCGGPESELHSLNRPEHERCQDCFLGYLITPEEAMVPTQYPPGSQVKAAVMMARYEFGIAMHMHGDERSHEGREPVFVLVDEDEDEWKY